MKAHDRNVGSRRSIRLKPYDYSQTGYYFLTVCAQNRQCVFGEIINGKMKLNEVGEMIETDWNKLPWHFPNIKLDEFVIMPNHMHGIILIVGAPLVGAQNNDIADRATTRVAPTLGDIVGAFKSIAANEYIHNVKNNDWPPFKGSLWQRNYYEHIIRDERDLNRVREYVVNNPYKWQEDEYYTA